MYIHMQGLTLGLKFFVKFDISRVVNRPNPENYFIRKTNVLDAFLQRF